VKRLIQVAVLLSVPSLSAALAQTTSGPPVPFFLCAPKCGNSEFYVGFEQNNTARMNQVVSVAPPSGFQVFKNLAEVKGFDTSPRRSEARAELFDGNFTISLTRIEELKVGLMHKSESILSQATTGQGSAESQIRLVWGDTLRVESATLPSGAPVTLTLTRVMGGFAGPSDDLTFFNVRSQTRINGEISAPLDFTDVRLAGAGEKEVVTGQPDAKVTMAVKVGDVLRLEGLLNAVDGAQSSPNAQRFLNGGDSASYSLTAPDDVCVNSSSGRLNAGRCG
jgi:hypothetical protein